MAGLIEMNLHGWSGMYELLRSLPPAVVSKRGGPVKAALRKGANVILKAERANLRAVMGHQVDGEQVAATGLLLKSLVTRRGKAPADGNGERYIVGPKRKTYPGRKGSKPVSTLKTAQLLEYGSSRQAAEPFIRPAFNAKAASAARTVETELVKSVDKIVAKLAQQNKGK
jgi:HK97 gp10 family phage protein